MIGDYELDKSKSTLTRKIWLYSSPILAGVVIYSSWVMFSRWQENRQLDEKAAADARARDRDAAQKTIDTLGGDKFDILGFYVTPGAIRRGESAQLCYGVSNAKSVTLDPPVADTWPSVSRCMNISPKKTTKYTLTASDAQGNQKSISLELEVH